jgi:hypothetical protein
MKDGYVMDKIKEKSAQDNRSVSQWSYLVLRKAALDEDERVNEDNNNNNTVIQQRQEAITR